MFRNYLRHLVIAALVGSVVVATPASSSDGCFHKAKEDEFITKLNDRRVSNGRSRLPRDLSVTRVARHHSGKMLARNDLFHSGEANNPYGVHSVKVHLTNWQSIGEIVGRGSTVDGLVDAFMNSSQHRAIVLDTQWTHIGVGVETSGSGTIYVTGLFVRSSGNPGTTFHAC